MDCEGQNRTDGGPGQVDWEGLARELLDSGRGMRRGRGVRPKDMEMRGEANVLHVLHHYPKGVTPTALARDCQVSSARIAKTINQLEGRGLVRREASPSDRRSVIVHLTDEGEREVQRRFERVNSYVAGVLRELGEDDARELVRLVGRLARIMEGRAGCGSPASGERDGADEAR
jgi:DNA-binding MarR family transcriptional regulator